MNTPSILNRPPLYKGCLTCYHHLDERRKRSSNTRAALLAGMAPGTLLYLSFSGRANAAACFSDGIRWWGGAVVSSELKRGNLQSSDRGYLSLQCDFIP